MSVRYTGQAAMDERALHDLDRWKEKIEVRLDNRQVFFLFFGSAMVACLLFVLGVIVGKRLESRGRAEAPPAVQDPLAALDRLAGAGAVAPAAPVAAVAPAPVLTYPRTLMGGSPAADMAKVKVSGVEPPAAPAAVPPRSAKLAALPRPLPPAPAPAPARAPAAATEPRVSSSPAARVVTAATADKPTAGPAAARPAAPGAVPRPAAVPQPVTRPAAPPPAARPAALPPAAARSVAVPPAAGRPAAAPPATGTRPAVEPKPEAKAAKGKFLLQLNGFQDRKEADAFARRLGGQSAHVVPLEVPGKGTLYRVRVGSYGSLQEATTAKAAFEREHNVIAYVAGTGPAR